MEHRLGERALHPSGSACVLLRALCWRCGLAVYDRSRVCVTHSRVRTSTRRGRSVCVCSFATNRATQTDLQRPFRPPPYSGSSASIRGWVRASRRGVSIAGGRGESGYPLITRKGPGPASRARDRFTAWVGVGDGGEGGRELSNAGYPSS